MIKNLLFILLTLIITQFSKAQKFTIIAIPDTQHYTDVPENETNFAAQTQWITDKRDSLNIVFVTGLGDIVQNPTVDDEWQIANSAYNLIEDPQTTLLTDGIPYGLAVGNHDMSPIGDGSDANTDKYNEYFGEARFINRSYYGGHHGTNNDNSYQLFSASGLDFVIIHFEYDQTMETDVLDWGESVLIQHCDRRVIITTHQMIGTGNPASFSTQGQAIFDRFKSYENVFLMLGGHHAGEGMREDIGTKGNTITSILSDYQSRPMGGEGFLRMMEFSPEENLMRVKTYSPVLDSFGTSTSMNGNSISEEFIVTYNMTGTEHLQTATLQDGLDGYNGTQDTYIFTTNPSVVRGGESTFIQDNESNGDMTRTAMLKFDLTSIPSSSTILSASLEFNVAVEGQGFTMHKLLKAWDEATINFTNNNGHFMADDTDAEMAIDSEWPGVNDFTGKISLGVPANTIQEWVDGRLSNNGWLMLATDLGGDGQQLSSRESTDQSVRPKLMIKYVDEDLNTVNLQEGVSGYDGTDDTYIWDNEADTDHSSDVTMVQDVNNNDERRSLLKFDLTSIPAGAQVVSAKIDFNVAVEGQGFNMHRMNVPWVASATYNSIGVRHYEADDVDANSNTSAVWPGIDNFTGNISVQLQNTELQNWINRTEENNGWLMTALHPSDGQQLSTSEEPTVNLRPRLIIQHIVCPVNTIFENDEWSAGQPCSTSHAIIAQDYDTAIYGSIDAASCTVQGDFDVNVADGDYVKTWE